MVRNEEEQKTSVTYEFVMVQQGISLCHWLALPNELQYMLFYYYMVYILHTYDGKTTTTMGTIGTVKQR